jgi:large subunit ribosomal protein L29
VKENRPVQLRTLTVEELGARLRQLREEMFNLRFRNAMSQLDNPLRIREVRRDIARMETLLTENGKGIRRLAEHRP